MGGGSYIMIHKILAFVIKYFFPKDKQKNIL